MLLKPDIKLDRITEITPELLRRFGIDTLILDVDNTLSTHHGMQLVEGLSDWLCQMENSGIKLTVLSNSLKKRVEPFAQKIGLPFISAGLKPLPFGFWRAKNSLGSKLKSTAIVGDQIFTDVLGGSLAGVKKILLTPIKPEAALRFRIKRRAEKAVFKIYSIKKTEV